MILARVFGAAVDREEVADSRIDEALHGLWARGRARWPRLDLSQSAWARHLGERVQPRQGADVLSSLLSLHAEDFYLACGCALEVTEAMVAFDQAYLSQLPVLLSQLRLSSSSVEEVGQVLRERLLVGHGGTPPKIAAYAGEGPLLAWLRTVAIRTALNLLDSRDYQVARDGQAADELPAGPTPEEELIGRQQREELFGILQQAFRVLPPLQRRALRLHFAEALTGDEIAARLGVHRATVVRWLSTARRALLQETERLFRTRLDLSAGEVESLVAETRSQLDVSLSVLLRTVPLEGRSHE